MVHDRFGWCGWMPVILDWIAAGKRPGSVPRFDDIAFAAIRLE